MAPNKAVILCVDDEDNALVLRKGVLERAGYVVMTAISGEQALELLASHEIDLVLSDYLMPKLTGTNLARAIKASRPKLPVILLSGVREIPTEADFADLFLSKTEGPVSLCAKIDSLLHKYRSSAPAETPQAQEGAPALDSPKLVPD